MKLATTPEANRVRNAACRCKRQSLERWVSDNTFIWLISEEILNEYKEVLARQKVRRELIGRIDYLQYLQDQKLALCFPHLRRMR